PYSRELFRLPQFVLLAAMDARTGLREGRRRDVAGRPQIGVVVPMAGGGDVEVFFDAATFLVTGFSERRSIWSADDHEKLFVFTHQAVGPQSHHVPVGRRAWLGEELVEDIVYEQVAFDDEARAGAMPQRADWPPLEFGSSPRREQELAPGLWLVQGLPSSGYNVLVAEFDSFAVVVEPPAGSGHVIEWVARRLRKPIRWVVPTHHHLDHVAGIGEYVANGTAILTTAGNREYFERVAGSSARVEVFEGVRTISDGERVLHLIDIGPNAHAAEHIVAYAPAGRLVFQGDVWRGTVEPLREAARELLEQIESGRIAADRIAGVHGPTTDTATLRAAAQAVRPLCHYRGK
ncbi:MAG: MBL fold metallo-hydrolase, partial [Gemmatimonadota bacterium]|nr:MBL fold metallo-hydrolase [Gemmatimonadota bacterium]